MNNRFQDKAIERVIELVKRQGFFYALLIVLFEDNHIKIDDIKNIDPNKRISNEEANYLLGYAIKEGASFIDNYPASLEQILEIREEIYNTLKELQDAPIKGFINGKNTNFDTKDAITGILTEAIRYDADSAYDYEYLDFCREKYKYVADWLIDNRSFAIDEVISITKHIKSLLNDKANKVVLFDEEFIERFSGGNPSIDIRNSLTIAQFTELLDEGIYSPNEKTREKAMIRFCNGLLDLFTFGTRDIIKHPGSTSFLKNFSLDLTSESEINIRFEKPGNYNLLDSKPILKIGKDKYFIPYMLNVFRAVYETPYYWMIDDEKFRKTAGDRIGKANEDCVFNMMQKIFGKDNTYQGIRILKDKKHEHTDIDVLCVVGTKAICVQVKSKKLTEQSKLGNYSNLLSDFEKSVMAAYEQGVISRNAILNKGSVFVSKENKQIELPISNVDSVYIMCIMCGSYEGLAHHVDLLFDKQIKTNRPVVCSIFDLHLLSSYLTNPLDFTYYIRQRVESGTFFKFTNEISALGYHLSRNLHRIEGAHWACIDDSFAREIDQDYIPYLYGYKNTLNTELRWLTPFMKHFCSLLKSMNAIDTLFLIYDRCTKSINDLENPLKHAISISIENDSMRCISLIFDDINVGLTVCASSSEYLENLIDYARSISLKYINQRSETKLWHIIGFFSKRNIIAFVEVVNTLSILPNNR